ncbi:hypothetical protein ABZ896_13490 [Streptomyces sp. NPDC047072]|uniref:hypothetical protein n=1 Tax=Streptomyces sp. NPDC047072 TaxID=3154809 RepID=UPI0033D6B7B5
MTFTAAPATVVVDAGHELAEGGRWMDGRSVYVGLLTGRLNELYETTGKPACPRQLAWFGVPLGRGCPGVRRAGRVDRRCGR